MLAELVILATIDLKRLHKVINHTIGWAILPHVAPANPDQALPTLGIEAKRIIQPQRLLQVAPRLGIIVFAKADQPGLEEHLSPVEQARAFGRLPHSLLHDL